MIRVEQAAAAQSPDVEFAGPSVGLVRQRLCIVVPTTGEYDSRTHRIAESMAGRGHDVVVLARGRRTNVDGGARRAEAGVDRAPASSGRERHDAPQSTGAPTSPGAEARPAYRIVRVGGEASRRLPLPARVLDRALATRRQRDAARRAGVTADLYHGMAFLGIPVALDLGRRSHAPVVYDVRDLYADARGLARLPRPARALVRAREARWARAADGLVTVNEELATVLAERFGAGAPAVVRNCPPRWTPGDRALRPFHDRLGLPHDANVVLYHGGLEPGRGIEELLAAEGLGEDVHIVLLGYGRMRDALAARLAADGALRARVHLLDPVPPDELLAWVHGADVVAVPIQPTTLNHRLSTPNKLFEALGAGVPVVASDFAPMRRVVLGDPLGPLGAVCDPADPAALARALRSVLGLPPAERADLRARCLRAAHERYAWESQLETLIALYSSLTGRPW